MGILSDHDIKSRINELFRTEITDNNIQPTSVDLHLDNKLMKPDGYTFILTENFSGHCADDKQQHLSFDSEYVLHPNEFILGSTKEYVTMLRDLVAQVDGKSSLGRLGIAIHITAGFIDPNFHGNITLEIKNVSNKPFTLKDGMPIAQLVFFTLTSPCDRGYGDSSLNSHYQDSDGVKLSRYEY